MRALVLAALGVLACGPSGIGPAAQSSARVHAPLPAEEERLDRAVAVKRAGDPISAWKIIEDIPASSPARLDDRYNEVMAAYSDARAHQIGLEIAGNKGGGPSATVETTPSAPPPASLSAKTIDRYVNEQRATLRSHCYGERSAKVSFELRLRIDTDGRVLDASLRDVRGESGVAQCVRDRARTWVFPRSSEGAEHRTKFIFGG